MKADPVGDRAGDTVDELSDQAMQQKLDALPQYTCDFLDATISGQTDVVVVQNRLGTNRDKTVQARAEPVINKLNNSDFNDLDDKVCAILQGCVNEIMSGLLLDRFKANLTAFEDITGRPPLIKDAHSKEYVFENAYRLLELVKDNMFHVKVLAAQLRKEGLLAEGTTDEQYQGALRPMFALVAVMYGCVREGSVWLTVMDSLIEDLARLVRGQVDPRHATEKMTLVRRMRTNETNVDQVLSLSDADRASLKLDDVARRRFAELARFYLGAVMLAFAAVSWKSKSNDESWLQWYGELLQWQHACGAETCTEDLIVRRPAVYDEELGAGDQVAALSDNEAASDENDEISDDDAMVIDLAAAKIAPKKVAPKKVAPKKKSARDGVISRSRYGLSVGVLDARKGFPSERAQISENREWAYPCLYRLTCWNKWHPGFGPFFHYFAHLWHSPCMPARDKIAFIMTIDNAARKAKDAGQ